MTNFVDFIDDKEAFAAEVKHTLNQKVFAELDNIKRDLATDFINDAEGIMNDVESD